MKIAKKYVGQFVELETDEYVYVGTLRDNGDGTVSMMSGLRGRPPVIYADDVVGLQLVDA